MGKRYYCDYCDKTMVAAPLIIKTHIKGVLHQKLVSEHYQHFKDVETILEEESIKKPCSRFIRGNCNFGSICRFSHYTPQEISAMKEYVAAKKRSQLDKCQPSFEDLYEKLQNEKSLKSNNSNDDNTIIYDNNGVTHELPWVYNPMFDIYGSNLPPSIKRLKSEDFVNVNFSEWG